MDSDAQRIERRVDRHEERLNVHDTDMSAMRQRVQGIERDVSALGNFRDSVIRLQAQWENFLKSDLPELNAKLDKLAGLQDRAERSRTQDRENAQTDRVTEREEARRERRNTLIALASIAAILLAAVVPILLTSH